MRAEEDRKMSANTVVLQGIVQPDGTPQWNGTIPLPVAVATASKMPMNHPFWQMMQEIRDARQRAGLQPRSVEVIEAERQRFRDEIDEEIADAGRNQDESQRLRLETEKPKPGA